MTKPHVLQIGPFPEWDQAALDASYTMLPLYNAPDKAAYLAEVGPQVEAIATRGSLTVDGATLRSCPNAGVVAVYGVGFDGVDMEQARAQGVRVTNTPDVLTEDVADAGLAMMLALGRRLVLADAWVRTGTWAEGPMPLTRRVNGRRVGILGLGRIGQAVARRVAAFGCAVSYCDLREVPGPWTRVGDAEALARDVDVLFATLAATGAPVVTENVLEALGNDGWLINISRASCIDEEALLSALEGGRIAGAALDVFENEPAPDPRFAALDNVVLAPHCASGTYETRKAMGALMRANLEAYFEGKPLLTPV